MIWLHQLVIYKLNDDDSQFVYDLNASVIRQNEFIEKMCKNEQTNKKLIQFTFVIKDNLKSYKIRVKIKTIKSTVVWDALVVLVVVV